MERFENNDCYESWYEHWHRYHWIAPHLKNKRVADLACGEGYGAALLSQHAQHVVGIDIDAETVAKAQQKYAAHKNLSLVQGDVLETGLDAGVFDVVVSFETLEHLSQHDSLLKEYKKILKPQGLLVISTPDKSFYSEHGHHNHHHVKELNSDEFKSLVEQHFKHHQFFGQKLHFGSTIEIENNSASGGRDQLYIEHGKEDKPSVQQQNPMYLIAVATDSATELANFKAPNSNLCDYQGKLLQHHDQQIKRLKAADQRIPELEQQLKQQLALISHLKARLGL